jgi:peptidyl-prolyl cis-trans isomerase D
MLNFRSSGIAQGIMAGIVVLIIAVFAFPTLSGAPTASLDEECAVDYAGHCVDAKDYYAAVGLIARGVPPKASRQLSLRRRVLDGLAERELLYEAARGFDLGISDDAIEKELTEGRAYVSLPVEHAESLAMDLGLCRRSSQGCEPGTPLGIRQIRVRKTPAEPFDYNLYQREIRILANRGPREFRAAQEREIIAARMRELVRARVRVPDNEAFSIYERSRSRAVVRSVTLERSWFGKFAVDQSDATIEKWAIEHASQVDDSFNALADVFAPDCPLVSEISVPLSPIASDNEKTAARERIGVLRDRVQKGESFENVAREASASVTAAFGGRVGCPTSSYGPDSQTIRAAAQKLERGALSDVIETSRALVLLRLDGKLDKAAAASEGRLQTSRMLYLKFKQDEAMQAFARDLTGQVKAGDKLEDVVKAMTDEIARRSFTPKPGAKDAGGPPGLHASDRPKFEVSPPFTLSGNPLPDVEPREPLAARAFALGKADTIDEKPIETSTGLVVIQLKELTPASREEFEKDKWTILASLRQAKAADAIVRYVADLERAAGDKLTIHAPFGEEPKATDD